MNNILGQASNAAGVLAGSVGAVGDMFDHAANTAAEYAAKQAEVDTKRELQLSQDAEKFALERTRTLADHYADMAELDQDFYRDRAGIINDMRADLADLDRERADELAELNDDLQDLARDHADKMRDIERDANRDIQTAAARFDAWGVYQAQQQRRDALEDEQKQYNDEKTDREEQFADRLAMLDRERDETLQAADQALRDLEDKHQRERSENERAFAEELRREDENRRLELQHQQQQWALEDQQRRDHYGVITTATATHHANVFGIVKSGLTAVEGAFAATFNRINTLAAAVPSSVSSRAASGSRALPTPYAAGGYPPVNQDVLVGEYGPEIARFMVPTRIYPNGEVPEAAKFASAGRTSGAAGGVAGVSKTINVERGAVSVSIPPGSALDPQAIGEIVRDEMIAVFEAI